MGKEICEITNVHEDVVQHVKNEIPDLTNVLMLMKALADDTRLKIVYALTVETRLCVCDVADIIGTSVATASHHLRYLKEHRLAKSERVGKQVFYSLADDHIYQIVTIAYEHGVEDV